MTDNSKQHQEIQSLPLVYRGKVRDVYEFDSRHFLMVTSNRLSAFDVVFNEPVPGKGAVLNQLSNFWFEKLADIIPNHTTAMDVCVVSEIAQSAELALRCTIVKKAKPLLVEAIVRDYLIGSGWKEYCAQGSLCSITLPAGLVLAEKLPETLYTPSSKAEIGEHDVNISFSSTVNLLGEELAAAVRDAALKIYARAAQYALSKNIIIADTKFEFGLDQNGELILIDEVLTPDSSRFWSMDTYQAGLPPPSFDKQFVRDWLESIGWDKTPPAPALPDDIIAKTAEKYQQIQARLMPNDTKPVSHG